jgi:hypothetical protein
MGAACSTCGPNKRREDDIFESIVVDSKAEKVETTGSKDSIGKEAITKVNQYRIQKMLGKGSFGAVYSATDQHNQIVAVKLMDKGELRKKSKGLGKPKGPGRPGMLGKPKSPGAAEDAGGISDTILREIATMKRVRHVNCVRLFEVIDDPLGDRMFLVMEFLDGGEVLTKGNLPDGKVRPASPPHARTRACACARHASLSPQARTLRVRRSASTRVWLSRSFAICSTGSSTCMATASSTETLSRSATASRTAPSRRRSSARAPRAPRAWLMPPMPATSRGREPAPLTTARARRTRRLRRTWSTCASPNLTSRTLSGDSRARS